VYKIKNKKKMEKNCFIEGNFIKSGKFIDKAISSVVSYEDAMALCKMINLESLKKQQKERLVKKLIKFSNTYDEILSVKDYYVKILQYSLTDKQIVRLIEKLVWASTDNQQLEEVKKYARSKGLLSRYMKAFFGKRIAEVLES
jgi:hypothetical protein